MNHYLPFRGCVVNIQQWFTTVPGCHSYQETMYYIAKPCVLNKCQGFTFRSCQVSFLLRSFYSSVMG